MRAAVLLGVMLLAGCAAAPTKPEAVPEGPQLVALLSGSGTSELAVGVTPDDIAVISMVAAGYEDGRAWVGPAAAGPFANATPHDGPGDVDLASSSDGVHATGLRGKAGQVTWQRWADGAWSEAVDVSGGELLADRPFIDARDGTIAVSWNGQTSGYQVAVSRDAGATWAPPARVGMPTLSAPHGGVAVGPDGSLAVVYTAEAGVTVATSKDGVTWTSTRVGLEWSWGWPSVAFDDEGPLFALWSPPRAEGGPRAQPCCGGELQAAPVVRYATSEDGGQTWSAPRTLTDEGHAGYYPWIDARGDTAVVSWYDVEIGANDGRGRMMLAFLRGDSVEYATPTPEPVPMGFSCADALRCEELGPVGESHDVALRADGSASVAWFQMKGDDMEVWYASVAPRP